MNLAKDATTVFQLAVQYAGDNRYEYVTPEMVLLIQTHLILLEGWALFILLSHFLI